ncbi:MAG: hypothetical protein N2322_04800 [Terrimicrobiaceae bacterium]|nr:hypothetical protein [Terrimicrobiaceae bacterium]
MKTSLIRIPLRAFFPLLAAGLALAAEQATGVNSLLANLPAHEGRQIAVIGHVDRVSASRRMVILIDLAEAGCADGCERKTLLVQLPEGAPMPAKGANILVTGTLRQPEGSPTLDAAAWESAR